MLDIFGKRRKKEKRKKKRKKSHPATVTPNFAR